MGTLYSALEGIDTEIDDQVERDQLSLANDQVSQMVETQSSLLETAIIVSQQADVQHQIASSVVTSLESFKPGTTGYFAMLDTNRGVIEVMAKRMGVTALPATEDFKNEFAMKSSHSIATESVKDFLKKTWEAIKKFFREFFKKVTIFLKRIVGANLDLASYEKYNDSTISKLKSKDATISNNTPLTTKLPSLIANQGQESVNTDFFLSVGMTKIKNLTNLLQTVGRVNGAVISLEQIKAFKQLLQSTITAFSTVGVGSDQTALLDKMILEMKQLLLKSLSSGFQGKGLKSSDIPDDCYEKFTQEYSSVLLRDPNTVMMSLVQPGNQFTALPKDANIFIATQSNGDFVTVSHVESNSFVRNEMSPIAQINNLAKLQDEYKRMVKEFDVKKCVSMTESIVDEINSILDILATKYVNIDATKGTELEMTKENCQRYIDLNKDNVLQLKNYLSAIPDTTFDQVRVKNIVLNIYMNVDQNDAESLAQYMNQDDSDGNTQIKRNQMSAMCRTVGLDFSDIFRSGRDEETVSNLEKLKDLNRFLSTFFNRLQVIFKSLVSDLLGTYTEVRYEMVKYIYDSSKRFS